jgi:outer membrane protein OmpA-like peptidoglycan-associated protein
LKTITKILVLLLFPSFLYGQAEAYRINKTSFSKERFNEFSPVYYKDGIVFTANYSVGLANYSTSGNEGVYQMFFADTLGKVQLFSKDITSKLNDGPASFNSAGDTIYFSRNLIVKGKAKELSSPNNNLGIFSSVLINGEWINIKGFEFNNSFYNLSYDVTGPALSSKGSRLYFSSDMPGGYGGFDLYYSDRLNGKWSEPVNLGALINTTSNEVYPYVNGFGELLFSSDGHPGYGKKDIFITRFNGSEWEKPEVLLAPINSEYDDFGITTDEIMGQGYFSSNRGSSVDIYQFRTNTPQVFFAEPQKESSLCYSFSDSGSISVDTTKFYYLWDFGDGKKARGLKTNHCFDKPGEYKLRLDLIDKRTSRIYLCRKEADIKISNQNKAYISSKNAGIIGENFSFDALKSNLPEYEILSYSWNFGDGSSGSGAKAEHIFQNKGSFNVLLGIIIRSKKSGKVERRSVSKKIDIVSDEQAKINLEKLNQQIKVKYPDFTKAENIEIVSLKKLKDSYKPDIVYSLIVFTSKEKLPNNDPGLRRLSTRYNVKSVWDDQQNEYLYYVNRQYNAMSLHQTFLEIQNLGFPDVRVQQMVLSNPTDIELMGLIKTYGNSIDSYFDKSGRLTSTAYIMLNQLVKIMKNNPELKLELTVHTDNRSPESQNLNLSREYANAIADYLETRGISSVNVNALGVGSSRPIAPNSTNSGRLQNRRIDFLLSE